LTFRILPFPDRNAIFRRLAGMAFAFWLAAFPLLARDTPGHAQQAGGASLTPPQTVDFPSLSATLDLVGEDGAFVHGLQPGQVTLLEDGEPVPVTELRELRPGVELFVAINASQPLAIRDNRGVSRYDLIHAALSGWAGAEAGTTPMRYSLVVNGQPPATGMETRQAWLQAFQAYQPDLRNASPSLESLARAVDLAGMPGEEMGVDRAILYITPPADEALAEMEGLTARAVEAGVKVFVWMVSSAQLFDSPGAQALDRLAQETGGQFVPFSGPEALPDPQVYLDALGSLYRLQYDTAIRTSGSHSLQARIEHDGATITSPEVTFRLNVMPPNPIFLSPPLQVVRAFAESTPEGEAASGPIYENGKPRVDLLTPQSVPLQVIIEFPDGHLRPLAFTRLYVDDLVMHENTEEPFDRFEWNLEAYTTSGTHRLRLEARDNLGLSQSSLEMPVDVVVIIPPRDVWKELVESGMLLNGGAVLVTGVALTAVLVFASKRAGRARQEANRRRASRDASLSDASWHPETGPAEPRRSRSLRDFFAREGDSAGSPGEAPTSREKVNAAAAHAGEHPGAYPGAASSRPGWFRRPSPAPEASLVRLGEDGSPLSQTAIPLARTEVTIGRDPNLSTCLLDDPSVDGLHARLRVDALGRFLLADQGSVAGTWVNYAPISSEGTPLEHGDLIHFGRAVFRFQLGKPASGQKPSVTRLDAG
jgi:hypothetical protein